MESRMANGGGMIWAKRFYELGTPYTPEFKRFEKDFIIRGGPPDMLMIKARSHKPRGDIVFIAIPAPDLEQYPGFEEIEPRKLPESVTLLIGLNAEFERRFYYATV
jgi:hypothetical protein